MGSSSSGNTQLVRAEWGFSKQVSRGRGMVRALREASEGVNYMVRVKVTNALNWRNVVGR